MFFGKKEKDESSENLEKITALLIHAAKIDENFSETENQIIRQAILEVGANDQNIDKILIDAKKKEENSNQILEFTKEVKNMEEHNKIKIVETLWKIIYSNKEIDIYESNLMRRLTGLLYIDSKTMGDIKEKIKEENIK